MLVFQLTLTEALFANAGDFEFIVKGYIDLPGKAYIDNTHSYHKDIKMGFSLGCELLKYKRDMFGFGIGALYQFPREADEFDSHGKFSFMPIYGMLKVNFSGRHANPFCVVHYGYNFLMGDDDFKKDTELRGGHYFSIGGGVKLKWSIVIEFLYSIHWGGRTRDVNGSKYDLDALYRKFAMSIGYAYGF